MPGTQVSYRTLSTTFQLFTIEYTKNLECKEASQNHAKVVVLYSCIISSDKKTQVAYGMCNENEKLARATIAIAVSTA